MLTVRNDVNPLLKLAIPMVLSGLMQSTLPFFENIFLAQLGAKVLAAGALVSWFFATLVVVIFGTFGSINVLISHQYGAKEYSKIPLVLRDGLMLAVLLTIPIFLLFWNISSIFLLFGQSSELVALAKLYLHGLAWGLFPKFILIVMFEFIMGLGHTRVILTITIITIPFYILMSFVLIFGKFGFPQLGIAGAGWGIAISDWIITSALSILLLCSKNYGSYVRSIFNFKKIVYLREIVHLGFPMGIMYCIEVAFFFAVALFMGRLSVYSLAANQLVMQYLCTLMSVVFSIASAITVRMGHLLGAKETGPAERAAYAGVLISFLFMLIVSFSYWITPGVLISVDFNVQDKNNIEIIDLAKQFFCIAAFFQILESIRIALFGALRGLKDTKFSLLASVICFWYVSLPIGLWFSNKLQGIGFWYAMLIGVICSIILLFWRFKLKMQRQSISI